MALIVNEVYTFKLTTGEEMVAKVFRPPEGNTVLVIKPVIMAITHQGAQLMQALYTGDPDKPVEVNMLSVVLSAPTRQEVVDSYVEATTGIRPVSRQIITG